MQIKYTKEELIDMIKSYYKEKKGKSVKVNITAKKELVGIHESTECVTTINIIETINFLGRDKEVSYNLSKDALATIFNELFESTSYLLDSLSYNEGIKNICKGFGMDERTEKHAYFNGVTLQIRENKLTRRR